MKRMKSNKLGQKMTAAMFICLLLIQCGTSASISKRDGTSIEGKIIGNDSENIYLRTYGKPLPIKKADIIDIDHPGNVVLVTGLGLLAYGIANIAVGVKNCDSQGGAYCTGVFTPAAVGLGMGIWGYVVWTGSVNNAEDAGKTVVTATLQPMRIQPLQNETVFYSSLVFNY